jgi:hypothetical protein
LKNAAKKLIDKLPALKLSLAALTKHDVLVGVPQDNTIRRKGEMNNATIAYIQDNGSPANNIPARPFMEVGIKNAQPNITDRMKKTATDIIKKQGIDADVDAGLTKVGMIAQASIRNAINEGIPPPLKAGTLKARIRNRTAVKGAQMELASRGEGNEGGTDLAKPLVATGQLRNSINFVIRSKK